MYQLGCGLIPFKAIQVKRYGLRYRSILSYLIRLANVVSTTREASFDIKTPFKLYKLDKGPASSVTIEKEEAHKIYTYMQTIRRMETACGALYREKSVRGFCHLYSGQEACAVGMKVSLRPQDSIITSYRSHGWTHLMGVPVSGVLAELTGREPGCARGKGGSMHMYATNFYGGNGIVGAQVPLGAGMGLASKYRGDGGVAFAMYGDGAASQGQNFEAYNMAFLLKIPAVFVCENNHYGMGTSTKRHSSNIDFYTRGDYIPGIWVDGMDVAAVKSATMFAIEYANKNGPLKMELSTYRYTGHSMSDPGTSYRTQDEVSKVRKEQDPINSFKTRAIDAGLLSEEDVKKIDSDIKKIVTDATALSKSAKEIPLEELWTDVYADDGDIPIRGLLEYNLKHKRLSKPKNL